MIFSRRGLRARKLVALILGITVIPLAVLAWLGWRLFEQDRIIEKRQADGRLEQAANLVVTSLQLELSSAQQRLDSGAQD